MKRFIDWLTRKPQQYNINVEYKRIRKPKKDEMIIFSFPDNTPPYLYERFLEIIKRIDERNDKYLIVSKSINITPIKRKKYNWEFRYKNDRLLV